MSTDKSVTTRYSAEQIQFAKGAAVDEALQIGDSVLYAALLWLQRETLEQQLAEAVRERDEARLRTPHVSDRPNPYERIVELEFLASRLLAVLRELHDAAWNGERLGSQLKVARVAIAAAEAAGVEVAREET